MFEGTNLMPHLDSLLKSSIIKLICNIWCPALGNLNTHFKNDLQALNISATESVMKL